MRRNAIGFWKRGKSQVLAIILIAFFVLSTLQFLSYREDEKAFLFDETYYYLRISSGGESSGLYPVDELQGRNINFNLFTYLSGFVGERLELAARILPVLLGVISLLLFSLVLGDLGVRGSGRVLTLVVLIISPVFIHIFSSYTPLILFVPLMLGGAFLYLKKSYFSIIPLGLLPLISIPGSIAVLAFLSAHALFADRKNVFFVNAVVMILVFISSVVVLGVSPLQELMFMEVTVSEYIVEFGASKGYSLITFVLSIIGLLLWWSRDAKKTGLFIALIALGAASIFIEDLRIIVFLFISFFSARAILYLIQREWNIRIVKNSTLLLILCSLVFSFVVTVNTSVSEASEERVAAMKYLSSTAPGHIILSSERNGFMISYLSGRTAFLDGNSFKYDDYEERKGVASAVYYSRNFAELEEILEGQGITHLLIDRKMMEGEIWNSPEEGVLLVLAYSDDFIKMFDNEEIQVYRHAR